MDDIHVDNERQQVETYLKQYCLEELLDETVNSVLESRPTNPYMELARLIESKSMAEILEIYVHSSLGEKGHGSVTATVVTNMGSFAGSFGLVTKSFIQDEEILKDHSMASGKLNDILRGLDPRNFREFDEKLCSITNINPSVAIAVSIACCRAGAKHRGVPLYHFLAECCDNSNMRIPTPVVTLVSRNSSGRTNTDGLLLLQDITMTATNVTTYDAALEAVNGASNLVKNSLSNLNVTTSLYSERGSVNINVGSLEDALGVSI